MDTARAMVSQPNSRLYNIVNQAWHSLCLSKSRQVLNFRQSELSPRSAALAAPTVDSRATARQLARCRPPSTGPPTAPGHRLSTDSPTVASPKNRNSISNQAVRSRQTAARTAGGTVHAIPGSPGDTVPAQSLPRLSLLRRSTGGRGAGAAWFTVAPAFAQWRKNRNLHSDKMSVWKRTNVN